MSILTYPLGFLGGGDPAFYNSVMENSLRITNSNTGGSAFLRQTHKSVGGGNRRTWTASWWEKRSSESNSEIVWEMGNTDGNHWGILRLNTTASYVIYDYDLPTDYGVQTANSFRDPAAWYHICFAVDTTQDIDLDRVKLFVNGERITLSDQYGIMPQNFETRHNFPGGQLAIGERPGDATPVTIVGNGYITDVYSIEGYALGPENFGEYKNGVWIPKEYAGPPPIITDSSSYSAYGSTKDGGALDYDKYYIGESSMQGQGNADGYDLQIFGSGDYTQYFFPAGTDWTYDFWIYPTSDDEGNMRFGTGTTTATDGTADHPTDGTGTAWYGMGMMMSESYGAGKWQIQGGASWQYWDIPAGTGPLKWNHISYVRHKGGTEGQIYHNGILVKTITTSDDAEIDDPHFLIIPSGDLSFLSVGRGGSGTSTDGEAIWVDEIRVIKGEARPPRFYFGTNHGDQTGGRLPQRATTDDRFSDDERTTLLISGQNANNHARTVSLVDESGFHTDNVHFSNSTFAAYPTQDGVGHQFTMSGPQHTTRESFVGNTSSIVLDTKEDRVEVTGPTVDGLAFTIDMWIKPGELAADWNEVLGFNTSTGGGAIYLNYYGAATPDYIELYTGTSGTQRTWYLEGFDAQNWHHFSLVRNSTTETDIDFYLNGHKAAVKGTSPSYSGNITGTHFEFGRREMTRSFQYYDEVRIVQSVDKPQIKWTHTQTAGAGNKDAYNIDGWRAHGHEFSDDNATELLIHGDGYSETTQNGTGALIAETAWYGHNTGNSPSNQATVYFAGDAAATRDTLMVAMWFQTTETALSYMSRFGWSVGNIAIVSKNTMKLQYGATTSWNVPCSDGRWHLVCAEYGEAADDIIVYFDGYKVYTEMNTGDAATYVKNDEAMLYIGSYNGTDYEFTGVVGQWAAWTHDAAADSNYMVENGVPKALFDAGPGANWKSATGDYSSTYAGFIRHYYAFGNQDSLGTGNDGTGTAHADTTTTVYDRAAGGSSYAAINLTGDGTITLDYTLSNSFKDSSSANSIHHALVQGGGSHHTKAVTLKSDGTNGTSTTDPNGNTIYFCGSNSSVTFANSSSFDYGNTSIFTANSILYVGTSTSSNLADFKFLHDNTSDWTISAWIKLPKVGSAQQGILGTSGGSSGNHGISWAQNHTGTYAGNMEFFISRGAGGQGIYYYANMNWDSPGPNLPDSWHHITLTYDASASYDATKMSMYINGIGTTMVRNFQNGSSFGPASTSNHSESLRIGSFNNSGVFEEYWDEIRIEKAILPPRFYLGNQTPATGATFDQFKYAHLDGTNDWYQIAGTSTGYNSFDFNGTGTAQFTVAAWVNQDSTSPTTQTIFGNMDGDSPYHGYTLKTEHGKTYFHAIGDNSIVCYGGYVTAGWTFIVGTMDLVNGVARLWKNGIEMTHGQTGGSKVTFTHNAAAAPSIGSRGHAAGNSDSDAQRDPFDGKIAHVGVWNDHLTQAEITAIYELGLGGNWATSYSGNMQGYWNFNVADGTDTPSTSTLYDLSGNNRDMAGVSIAAISTGYAPSNASKRLTYGPLEYSANVQSDTAITGNNYYANVKSQSVTAATFNSFVDDEYTVLLLRGGHEDGNTTFMDSNTAAGETITFPAHSHSFGKTRKAKSFTVVGSPRHENTNQLGLHGSSMYFDGTMAIRVNESGTGGNDFWFESGNFTIECWAYLADTTTRYAFGISDSGESAATGALRWSVSGSGLNAGMLYRGNNGTPSINVTGSNNFSVTTWHHVVIQRHNNMLQHFIDGVCDLQADISNQSPALSTTHMKSTAKFAVGAWGEIAGANRWSGGIDEFRVTKGICRYTPAGESQSGIVPGTSTGAGSTGSSIPTSPYLRPTPLLAADGGRGYFANTNVQLWIKSDTYPGDTSFVDSAGTIGQIPKTITNWEYNGGTRPILKTANSITDYALSGGQDGIYFDGTDDRIEIPMHNDLKVTANFTAECWFRQTYSGTNDQTLWSFANDGAAGSDNEYHKVFTYQSDHIRVSNWKNGYVAGTLVGADITVGAWHHVAIQREKGRFRLFLDGKENDGNPAFGTGTETMDLSEIWGSPLYIGAGKDGTGFVGAHAYQGYIDEFRWSQMPRYTGQGLIDSDYPNPGTEFGIQTEGYTYGKWDTQVTANTTYQRYNYQHSIWFSSDFNGTDEYARFDAPSTYRSDDTRGSVSVWFVPSGTAGTLFGGFKDDGTNDLWMYFYPNTNGTLHMDFSSAGTGDGSRRTLNTVGTFNHHEWNHLVITQDASGTGVGAGLKFYINGEQTTYTDGSHTAVAVSTVWFGSINPTDFTIGTFWNGGATSYYKTRVSQVAVWGSNSGTTGVLTESQVKQIYLLGPSGNVNVSDYNTGLVDYWTFGNQTGQGTDTSSTIYSQVSAGGSGGTSTGNDLTLTNMAAPGSDTKLLIHSNTDIDGDTSIVDSSENEHVIDRVVNDPKYANTGANRSSLAGASYNGIFFDRSPDYLSMLRAGSSPAFNVQAASGNTQDFTLAFWYRPTALFDNAGLFAAGVDTSGLYLRLNGGTNIFLDENNTSKINVAHGMSADTWYHIALTRSGAGADNTTLYKNGTSLGTAQCDRAFVDADVRLNWYRGSPYYGDAYFDQVMFIRGSALSSTNLGHLAHANANTGFGTLGGLILHEEYSDGTNTANAASTFLLHSNNATHHTQGSRKFYNDTANTRFTTTTGHAAAGRFTIGASSGIFTVLGAHQTGYSPAMNNPSIRFKRGYSYILSASSLSGHKLYFANSSANTGGSKYGADTGQINEYITGLYGTNSTVDGTETWTAFSAGHFLGGNGTTGQWNHIKFEVPTNAPKNLYYRCSVSGHQAMGNAAFIMEATEPAPVKVGALPTFKASTWNDRDYAGIGTNKSVMHFNRLEEAYFNTGTDATNWRMDGDATLEYWIYPTGTAVDYEGVFSLNGSGTNINLERFETAYHNDNYSLYHDTGSWIDTGIDKVLNTWEHHVWAVDGGTGVKLYIDGVQRYNNTDTRTFGGGRIEIGKMSNYFHGFMDEIALHKGVEYNANTVIERYQAGRAGYHLIANSACVFHVKSNTTYGDTTITDSSHLGTAINNYGVYHHIDDNRTANTALYFDGDSEIVGLSNSKTRIGTKDFTWEAWVKSEKIHGNGVWFSHWEGGTNSIRFGLAPRMWIEAKVGGTGLEMQAPSTILFPNFQWVHVSLNRHDGRIYMTCNGVVVANSTTNPYLDYTSYVNSTAEELRIGKVASYPYPWHGWMDGIRATVGFARYTSGIPLDGQSPHKSYTDGRSSNVSSATWATSSTRRYYGINTHTYLQTTEYTTNANTSLLIRGDDAETATSGVNMYGDNGFHLEFKEVGAGNQRDYNNFNTGGKGLGSDTSTTEEFSDESTVLLVRSRPNQANGSTMFVDETTQDTGAITGTAYHSTTKTIFGVDSNTANVSIASGGTRTY